MTQLEAQVVAALALMYESGLKVFGKLPSTEDELARKAKVYAAVLESAGVEPGQVQSGALAIMRRGGEFPSAGDFASECIAARPRQAHVVAALPPPERNPATPEEIQAIVAGMSEGARKMLALTIRLPDSPSHRAKRTIEA